MDVMDYKYLLQITKKDIGGKNMHSVQSYLSRLPAESIEQIIREYCADSSKYDEYCVLLACAELAKRRGKTADPFVDFRKLCESYLKK